MKWIKSLKWNQMIISLLIGLSLGTFFGQWHAKECPHKHWGKGDIKQHMMRRLNRELHLSPEQKKQIDAIFDAKHPQMVALHAEIRPKFEALRNITHGEIRKILNADQQKRFDEMNKKMEERIKKREPFF